MALTGNKSGIGIVLSGIAFAVSIMLAQFYFSWICLVPFFMALNGRKLSHAFKSGALFGGIFSAVLLYWMISLISDYAGSWLYGAGIYLLAIIISSLYYGVVALFIAWLRRSRYKAGLNALMVASVWTLGEWGFTSLFSGMPWFGLFRASNMILDNLYAIQTASFAGVFFLSFVVVFVNALIADYYLRKAWKLMAVPVTVIAVYMLSGYALFSYFEQRHADTGKPVSVAILCDNTPPDMKWDERSGGTLVKRLLALNSKAAQTKPDIALWSESVVPWTYQPDDDFVKAVLKETAAGGITHIMGITTSFSDKVIYNSAYCLLPDGKIAGRYDKQYPVSLAEQPLASFSLPFAGSFDRLYEKKGEEVGLLSTPVGKAGALICNDGTVPGATVAAVRAGAGFLVSLSNDAWFSHIAYLVKQHYLNTKLRAVEVRKDMVVNCNMGISGLVKASGIEQRAERSDDIAVANVSVYQNNFLTLYSRFPLLFIYILALFILIFIFNNIFNQ